MKNATAIRRDRVADWVDVAALDADPYPSYERLRREGPVLWAPALGRHLAASFDAAAAIEDDPGLFTAAEPGTDSTMLRTMRGRPMNRKDDPEHARDRKAEDPPLKPRAITRVWTEVFESTCDRFLDDVVEAGPGVDFMRAFARPYAADNLRRVIGLPNIGHDDMARWSKDLVDGIGNVTDDPAVWARTERTGDEIERAVAEVERDGGPEDSTLLASLVAAGLPSENVLANVKLTISGGMNEPQNVVGAAVWALLTHPEQRALVERGEKTYQDVFDEAVRWQTPIGMFPRTVTRDADFFGARLRAGDKISALTGAANRDPQYWDDPDAFDITRPRRPHFAFGRGTHMCAGMWVAKAQVAKVALPRIFSRLEGLELDTSREPSLRGWVFRGLTDLPLTWRRSRGRSTRTRC